MVSLRQEQNPIMNFGAPFLKMLALRIFWRAHFLLDFYAVFCVHQISESQYQDRVRDRNYLSLSLETESETIGIIFCLYLGGLGPFKILISK